MRKNLIKCASVALSVMFAFSGCTSRDSDKSGDNGTPAVTGIITAASVDDTTVKVTGVPTEEPENTENTVPTEVLENTVPTVPTEVLENTVTTVPTEELENTATTVPTEVLENEVPTVPTEELENTVPTVPTEVLENTVTTVPTEESENTVSATPAITGNADFGEEDGMFDKLPKGKWCDVNSNTILEFNGKKMHVIWWVGDTEGEDFKVKLETGEGYDTIVNTASDSYGEFGSMGKLTYRRDEGTISAYELILDGEGHKYLFVPEERLEEERSVKDLSEDYPKTIESEELKSFSLSLRHYTPDGLYTGNYSFTLIKDPDGFYNYEFEGMGDSYVIIQHRTEVDEEYAKGLVEILKDESILKHNGEFFSDRDSNVEYSLYARFEGKERMSIKVGNTALDRWPIDEKVILEYAMKIIPKEYFV